MAAPGTEAVRWRMRPVQFGEFGRMAIESHALACLSRSGLIRAGGAPELGAQGKVPP